jgi:hypothetical protein
MSKYLYVISLIILVAMMSGCKKNTLKEPGTVTPIVQPTALPTVTVAPTVTAAPENTLKIEDYYPFTEDTQYVYEGTGNEFAAKNVWTDFYDTKNNRIQTRTDNGGTETVKVIENKDGRLSVITSVNECYYRDNLLNAEASNQPEVLLMEPLVTGTQWTLQGNSKRSITNTSVEITTPSGTYQALEVTTEGNNGITRDYYAPKIGLVKTIYQEGNMEVTSSLKEIKTDSPFSQAVQFFYPNQDEKISTEQKKLNFHTNDDTVVIMENAVKEEAVKDTNLTLVSENTKINSLYLGKDNIVHIDFSKELVTDMNVGAGYEALILQSITNTLGNYYGVQKVIITVDKKPYESGHILMKEGEAFNVDMSKVVNE